MKFADQTGITELITLTKTALKPLEAFKNSVTDVNGIVKSNGSGGFSAAVAGTDYAAAYHTHEVEDVNGLDLAMLLKNVSIALPSGTWYDICYGEDRFVAVGEEVIAYSLDGFSWHLATSYPEYTRWALVRYGNGKFIAMPNSAAMAAYSTDGITWTSATLPLSSNNWSSLCYGGGKFVALAGDDRTVYSSDGITWTQGSMPDTSNWCAICYGNGKFVAVNASNKAAYSTNGITWTANKIADTGAYYFIAYGEINRARLFVALQRDSNTWATSADGIAWSIFSADFGSNYQIKAITFGEGIFVAQIKYEIGIGFAVLSSKDSGWIMTSTYSSSSSSDTNLFCYGNGLFISGYNSNNSCIFSVDGIEWNDGTRKNIVYPNSKIATNEVKEVLQLYDLKSELEVYTRSEAGKVVKFVKKGYIPKTGTTMSGPLIAQTNTSYTTAQMRNIIISTADPSGGNNGDIWLKYEA